jgi:hypothetical protein
MSMRSEYIIHFCYAEDEHMQNMINRLVKREIENLRLPGYSLSRNPQLGSLVMRIPARYYVNFALKWNQNRVNLLEYHSEVVGPAVEK